MNSNQQDFSLNLCLLSGFLASGKLKKNAKGQAIA